MESTSVYWIPIFELLDARGFTVFLVNARDAKHVPGRKTAALVLGYAHPGCPWVTNSTGGLGHNDARRSVSMSESWGMNGVGQ